jgi:hypothetical protein
MIVAGGAALLGVATPAWAEGVSVSAATAEQVEAAQETFRTADELFDVQEYDAAIAKYRESYDIVASPNSRLMVARGLRELGRLDEAFHEYEATLDQAEVLAEDNETYATTAQAARDELQALKSRVAWLRVELGDVPPDAEVTVSGKPVDTQALDEPIVVVPGRIDVVATTTEGRTARGEVHLAAGRESSVTLKLDETVTVGEPAAAPAKPAAEKPAEPVAPAPAPPEPPRRRGAYRPLAIVAGGIGVAGFAAFGIFGSKARTKFDDLESACANGSCPADSQDDIDTGKDAQLFANVGLAVGAVGLGASGALLILDHRHRREQRKVTVTIRPGRVAVEGTFR